MISYIKYKYIYRQIDAICYDQKYIDELKNFRGLIALLSTHFITNNEINDILYNYYVSEKGCNPIHSLKLGVLYPNIVICMLEDYGVISYNRITSEENIPYRHVLNWGQLVHKILI